ncbi:class I SAM-dependent methyltransferase family protein [Haloprofundus sp. MHR1]|uniref:class I SAM-dependent methyltransferase n=1 Tax=Haloprofundus sp. MHR1 TaxID=2572921 RepID=UPI0010BE264C|nr:class I SAM-dependent methyltransferase family protein [Haloprofundus sp. MHR1]QCJ47729.1 class I SAM-dependent methyltransferase family protein [Haloprofundus sp. MHR1]
MTVPCVRVPASAGEETRQALVEAGVVDHGHDIVADDGVLYIPVTDSTGVPAEYEVVDRDVPTRRQQRTPADVLGFEPSYERLGDIVILDEDDPERAREIADAVMDSDVRAKTVVNRDSKIRGELRVRDWELLVGSDTETVHREYGYEFLLDISTVYFSPRLATERHRVVDQVEPGERVFDMFAGVGPFAIPCAGEGAEVVAVDLNEAAVEYLRENARRNGVEERLTAIQGDVTEAGSEYENWADRIVMNLPHSAGEFLDTAVAVAGDDCVVHYYDIQHEDDPFGPGERAIRAAAEPEYEVTVLNERVVRSYAPHEYNVCLDVRLSR